MRENLWLINKLGVLNARVWDALLSTNVLPTLRNVEKNKPTRQTTTNCLIHKIYVVLIFIHLLGGFQMIRRVKGGFMLRRLVHQ